MLIGVAGYARSGKDEVGRALVRRGFTVTRFSQALKDEVVTRMPRTLDAIAGTVPWTSESIESWQAYRATREKSFEAVVFRRWLVEVVKPAGVRELLQEYGTEVRRGDDPDYWVKAWVSSVRDLLVACQDVTVVDVRFENEVRVIRDRGGKIWRVRRPGVGPLHDHASERQGFAVDLEIENDGTLDDLDERVGRVLGREI